MSKLKLEKARKDNWTKRFFFEGTSAKIGPSIDHSGFPVTGMKDAAEEMKFEKLLALPKGTLSKNSKYWKEFAVVVDGNGVTFDEDDPLDQLTLKFLKAQSLVAIGTADLLHKSKAEYVLFSEEDEVKDRNEARSVKRKATQAIVAMDGEELRGMVLMYGHNPSGMNENAIEDFIYEKAEEDPKTFTLMASDPSKEAKVFVHRLVKAGVLEVRGGAYLYNDESLGYGLDTIALTLQDKGKQELRIALEKQLIDK